MGNVLLVEAQSRDGNYLALSDSHNFLPPGGHYFTASTSNSAELRIGGKKKKKTETERNAGTITAHI